MPSARVLGAGIAAVVLGGCVHQPGPSPAAPATAPAAAASAPAARTPAVPAPQPLPRPSAHPAPKPPATGRKPPPSAPAARPTPAAPPAAAPTAAPALDLAGLEQRLRDTKAIGVFTKLSLKNQVDDLLGQFRDFYARKGSLTLADLRQRYDLLVLKVLSVLQEGDPALAAAISSSRESLWAILADPQKFGKLGH